MKQLLEYLDAIRGRRKDLAQRLGISPAALSMWKRVPHERVLDVERLTGIPRKTLRPDLYGHEDVEAERL